MEQDIRFIDFEGRRLAYATYGEGPPMVIGPRWVSHLDEESSDANQRAFYGEVAKTHRVVRFDRVGCGLSSRELEPRPTVEAESRPSCHSPFHVLLSSPRRWRYTLA